MSQKKNNQKKKDSSSGSSQQWQQDQELAAILGDLQALTGGKGSAFDYRKASQSKVELRSINLDEDEDEQEEDAESVGDEADVMEWEEGSVSASEGEAEEDTLLAEEEETSTKKRKDIESSEAETVAKKSKVTTATEEAVVEGEVKKSNKQLKKEKRLLERAQKQLDQQQPSTDITNTAKGTTETTATEGVEGGTSSWNFEVDYNDHFETPAIAYSDVLSLLDQLSTQLNKSKAELIIYDPYYCLGNMKAYLQQLGFINVINENRDFYKDIRTKKLPNYDILLTNPPYSGEHKIKLMQYLMSSTHANRPFALLLPLYTITKSYWKDYVTYANNNARHVYYILPPDYYEYRHPEGTGKDIPPFYSSWICGGLSKELFNSSLKGLRTNPRRALSYAVGPTIKRLPFTSLTVLESIERITSLGLVVDKRPNPKQRQKMKKLKST